MISGYKVQIIMGFYTVISLCGLWNNPVLLSSTSLGVLLLITGFSVSGQYEIVRKYRQLM